METINYKDETPLEPGLRGAGPLGQPPKNIVPMQHAPKTIPWHGTTTPNEVNHALHVHGSKYYLWPKDDGELAFHPNDHIRKVSGRHFDPEEHDIIRKWSHLRDEPGPYKIQKFKDGGYSADTPDQMFRTNARKIHPALAHLIASHLGKNTPETLLNQIDPGDVVHALGTDAPEWATNRYLKRAKSGDWEAMRDHLSKAGGHHRDDGVTPRELSKFTEPKHFGRFLGIEDDKSHEWDVGARPQAGGMEIVASKKGDKDRTILSGLLTREDGDFHGDDGLVFELDGMHFNKGNWDQKKAFSHLGTIAKNLSKAGVKYLEINAKGEKAIHRLETMGFTRVGAGGAGRGSGIRSKGDNARMQFSLSPHHRSFDEFEKFMKSKGIPLA